jgi:hypothetical protein
MNYFDTIIPIELWIHHILPGLSWRDILNLNKVNKWMNHVTSKTKDYNKYIQAVKFISPLYQHLMQHSFNPRICKFHCPWCPQECLSYMNNTIKKKRGATRALERKNIHKQHTSKSGLIMKLDGCQCPFCGVLTDMPILKNYTKSKSIEEATDMLINTLFVKLMEIKN